MVSTIVKGIKRAMVGEYSRELSVKFFADQCRLIKLGFRQDGAEGFELRRVLADECGKIKGELKRGEHKSLQSDRVILMPGPDEEAAWVNDMYRRLIEEGLFSAKQNVLHLICGISSSFEEVPAFIWLEHLTDVAESFEQSVERSGPDPPKVGFVLGEGQFDWIEIGTVGGQEQEPTPSLSHGLGSAWAFMRRQGVKECGPERHWSE